MPFLPGEEGLSCVRCEQSWNPGACSRKNLLRSCPVNIGKHLDCIRFLKIRWDSMLTFKSLYQCPKPSCHWRKFYIKGSRPWDSSDLKLVASSGPYQTYDLNLTKQLFLTLWKYQPMPWKMSLAENASTFGFCHISSFLHFFIFYSIWQ